MNKTGLTAAMLFLFPAAFAQHEVPVPSKITHVTVFLNQAQVTRQVKTRVDAGKTDLVISGLTAQLDPKSIQVSGKGNFTLLGISHRRNFLNEHSLPKSIRVLKDSLTYLQQQLSLENAQREILNKEEQMLLSNQKIGGTQHNITAAELKAVADFFRSRLNEIARAQLKQDEKIRKMSEQIARIQRQINEENQLYARNTSEIVVGLSADSPALVELDVSYVVSQAGWSPLYDLRAVNTKSPVQLSYKARVYQNTGEQWDLVYLKLSTANPVLGGTQPQLQPWYVDFYTPPPPRVLYRHAEREKAMMAAPASEADTFGYGAKTMADYVQTVQASLSTEFDIALPYTIPSSGKEVTVDIAQHQLQASYSYIITPKLDKDAFLLARVTGWEELSLLPGPANVFFEGTFVTETHIDPVTVNDTLGVSLGRDKRIAVTRTKIKDFTSTKLIGSNKRETYGYEISVRNNKHEPVQIKIEDHVPVSQNSQIVVALLDNGGAAYDVNTGKLVWELNLNPNESRKTVYKFELKYPKDKRIAGLD